MIEPKPSATCGLRNRLQTKEPKKHTRFRRKYLEKNLHFQRNISENHKPSTTFFGVYGFFGVNILKTKCLPTKSWMYKIKKG